VGISFVQPACIQPKKVSPLLELLFSSYNDQAFAIWIREFSSLCKTPCTIKVAVQVVQENPNLAAIVNGISGVNDKIQRGYAVLVHNQHFDPNQF
jgi:hypothetical protein